MSINVGSNAFLATLAQSLAGGGAETTIYLSTITNMVGEAISTADFGTFGKGTITIDPLSSSNIEFASFTGVDSINIALTGGTRNLSGKGYSALSTTSKYHPAGTQVIIAFGTHNLSDLITYVQGIMAGTIGNASSTVAGITKLSLDPVSPTAPIAVGDNDTRVPTTTTNTFLAQIYAGFPGIISPYAGRSAPTGWLMCDGSAVSRSTYSLLLAAIAPSQTATVTIASPAVVTANSHGLVAGDKVSFTTTIGLPSGISAGVDYYVIAAGLTSNAFEFALTPGGAAVNTSGSQSGVHTIYKTAWGCGDGTTTFNVPDLRSRAPIGLSASAPTTTLSFEPAAVSAGSDNVTIIDTVFPSQGQKVQLTTTGTLPAGLSLLTDYYIVRSSSTTIKFSSSQANCNATSPTVIDITDQGTGVHTLTFTNRAQSVLGRKGGEETHGIATSESPSHTHDYKFTNSTGASSSAIKYATGGTASIVSDGTSTVSTNQLSNSGSTVGSDAVHNIMQPFVVLNYIIKT